MKTIADIASMDDGDLVSSIKGELTAIYDRRAGIGKNDKPYSFQDCELKDATGKIKVVLNNREGMDKSLKGQVVTIECQKSEKGKTGVYVQDQTYNGITTRKLRVTGSAVISNGSGSVSQNDTPTNKEFKDRIKAVVAGNGSPVDKTVYGGTAGCAVKLAVDVLMGSYEGDDKPGYFTGSAFLNDVYQVSSGLVRVMQTIESGKLAPEPVDPVIVEAKELFQVEGEDL